MNRFTWILYLIGAALVLASWLGLVGPALGWVGWAMATGAAIASWCGWLRPSRTQPAASRETTADPGISFTAEEQDAARREIDDDYLRL